jgi:hypothetical protein
MRGRVLDWLRPLIVDRSTRTLLASAFVANALAWALLLVRLWPLIAHNRIVALHYSIYIGVDNVGYAWQALLTPIFGLVAFGANVALSRFAYIRDRMITISFMWLTLFYELAVLVASAYVVLINLRV